MKNFLRTFALMAVMFLSANSALWAQSEVTIGSLNGATENSYLPVNTLYNYSYSQQIYTAAEIGRAGTIDSITFWLLALHDYYTTPITIYMVELDKETFISNTDWVTVTEDDIVCTDTLNVVHCTIPETYTIVLDTPFVYSGTGNLLIAVNNTCGIWNSGLRGMTFSDGSGAQRAIYARRDGNIAYDPYEPTFNALEVSDSRNVITLYITLANPSSIGDPADDTNVSIFPNPASGNVVVSGIEGEATVTVVDMNGRTVFTTQANESTTIDLAGFAQGAYLVRISSGQTLVTRKLVVK